MSNGLVPAHWAIEFRGRYFSAIDFDFGAGPLSLIWTSKEDQDAKRRRAMHVFQTEGEAREVLKLCPPGSTVVPAAVVILRPEPLDDSEGGTLD